LAAVPAEGSSISGLSFSVSTVSLFKYSSEHRVLFRIGEKFADPNDLLEPLIFADLKNDLLGARELAGREPVTPVNNERDVVVTGNEGRGRNPINGTPRKSKGSRFIERSSRTAHESSNTYQS
jgi:hypothetical protein